LIVTSPNTARVQECHLTIGHLVCELVENDLAEIKPAAGCAAGNSLNLDKTSR
jgi:hypothetical protein